MKVLIAAIASFLALTAHTSAQIIEMNGTWVLNIVKTLGPHPDSETLIFEIRGGEQRYTMEYANENGETGRTVWAVKCDGKDHPAGPGSTTRTVSLKRLGAKTELVTHKQDGSVTATYTRVLVDDDNTIISIGRDANNKIEWVRVFEKQ